jgi:hypothetical protein
MPLAGAASAGWRLAALERLVARGLVMMSGVTPSDASHVLGRLVGLGRGGRGQGAAPAGRRRRVGSGDRIAPDAPRWRRLIIDQLTARPPPACWRPRWPKTAFAGRIPAQLAAHPLMQAGVSRPSRAPCG